MMDAVELSVSLINVRKNDVELTLRDISVLLRVPSSRSAEISPSALGDLCSVSRPDTSRIIKKLAGKYLITRGTNNTDMRTAQIKRTQKGDIFVKCILNPDLVFDDEIIEDTLADL